MPIEELAPLRLYATVTFGAPSVNHGLIATLEAFSQTFGAAQVAAGTGALLLPQLLEAEVTFGAPTITGGMTAEALEQRFYGTTLRQLQVWTVGRTLPLAVTEGAMMVFADGAWRVMAADGPAGAVLTNVGGQPQFVAPAAPTSGYRAVVELGTSTVLDATHDVILVDTTADPVRLDLPAPAGFEGKVYLVRLDANGGGSNVVILDADIVGGALIEGATTYSWSTLGEAHEVICTGSTWRVIS